MKRYNMRDVTPYVTVHPDGEWVRYEDHVAALAQQPQGEAQKYCSDERPCINCFADNGQCLDAPVAQGLTDEQILVIGRQHFRPGHDPKAEPAFVNAVRAILAQSAPRASAGQAEKTVAAIDSALRGKVNDPDPLPKLHAHSVAGEPTTYGLVAALLRERDALLAKVAKFDQRIVDLGVLAMETAAPAPNKD